MITRYATLGPAPTSVRVARVVCPLVMCFAYLTLRVAPAAHDRIALGELITSGVLFVGLTFLAFIALGDLIDPEPLPPRLELEKVAAAASALRADFPAHRGRITGYLTGVEPGTEELELLTHEYVPQHHTHPRGFTLVPPVVPLRRDGGPELRARSGGRHRKA